MSGTLLSIVFSLVACSEYGLETQPPGSEQISDDPSGNAGGSADRPDDGMGEDPGEGEGTHDWPPYLDVDISDDEDTTTTDPDEEIDPDWDSSLEDDPENPPVVEIAEEHPQSECEATDLAPFDTAEIMVGNNGSAPQSASGVLTAPESGWYDVYDTPIQESGSSQLNESAFFRVQNASNPDGLPAVGNCGDEWVVADADNSGSQPGVRTYLGTFWLDAGPNTLVMTHYCTIWTSCPQFHDGSQSNQTCDSNNINSVHFYGDGVCVERI